MFYFINKNGYLKIHKNPNYKCHFPSRLKEIFKKNYENCGGPRKVRDNKNGEMGME